MTRVFKTTSAVLACVVAVAVLNAQTAAPTLHDLDEGPFLALNANIQLKKVMGTVGTFALGEFKAGFKSTPHHHTYEQINVGLAGAFTLPVAGSRHTVSNMRGVLIPPEVEHGNDVPADGPSPRLIEFQPVRRLDFPPEREKIVLPAAPAPQPVPQGRRVAIDFSAGATEWHTVAAGVRSKSAVGNVTAVSAWEFQAAAAGPVELRSSLQGAEQFVYVAEGAVDTSAGDARFAMRTGHLLVNAPNGPPLRVGRAGGQRATVLVFEARP